MSRVAAKVDALLIEAAGSRSRKQSDNRRQDNEQDRRQAQQNVAASRSEVKRSGNSKQRISNG
jgi:hypothetical protein